MSISITSGLRLSASATALGPSRASSTRWPPTSRSERSASRAPASSSTSTTWHRREAKLGEPSTNAAENKRYWDAFYSGDADRAGVMISEAVGLIHDFKPAGDIIRDMVAEAEGLLANSKAMIAS